MKRATLSANQTTDSEKSIPLIMAEMKLNRLLPTWVKRNSFQMLINLTKLLITEDKAIKQADFFNWPFFTYDYFKSFLYHLISVSQCKPLTFKCVISPGYHLNHLLIPDVLNPWWKIVSMHALIPSWNKSRNVWGIRIEPKAWVLLKLLQCL